MRPVRGNPTEHLGFPAVAAPAGCVRVTHRQGALTSAREDTHQDGVWCWGPHCRVSKRFYSHSREVEVGTITPIHCVEDKVT